MGLFKKSSNNAVIRHQENSDKAFKLFNDTISALAESENDINIDIDIAEENARLARQEALDLIAIKEKGRKFKANLEKLMTLD